MKLLIRILLTVLLFSSFAVAQFDYRDIYVPETAESDSFRVPSGNYYFTGIQFTEDVYSGMDTIFFKVTANPTGSSFDTLKYEVDGDLINYFVVLIDTITTGEMITLDFKRIYSWEWWKLDFGTAPGDSIQVRPIFKEF